MSDAERLAELRREAEKRLKQWKIPKEEDIPEDPEAMRRVIHELRVHQIELEMQNQELREAQQSLQHAHAQITELFSSAPVGYLLLDSCSVVLKHNETFAEMVQMRSREIQHKSFRAFLVPDEEDVWTSRFRAFFNQPESKEMEIHLKPRSGMPVAVRCRGRLTRDHGETSLMITLTDITDLRKAQEELAERSRELRHRSDMLEEAVARGARRERELTAFLRAARAVIEETSFDQAARTIFDVACDLTGAISGYVAMLSDTGEENELLFLEAGGLPCDVDPELPMPVRGLRAEAYHSGKVVYDNDFMNSRWVDFMPDGHVVLENVMFAPLNVRGKTLGVMGLSNKPGGFNAQDASMVGRLGEMAALALRNAGDAEALRNREEQYRQLVEGIPDIIYSFQMGHGGIYRSPRAGELLGYDSARLEAEPQLWLESIHPDDRPGVDHAIEEAGRGKAFRLEYRIKDSRGQWHWVSDRTLGVRQVAGTLVIQGVVSDITEQKRMEEHLRQSEKLEAIGQLAAGIAHDFNNQLTAVMSFSELLLDTAQNEKHRQYLRRIISSAQRGAGLTRQLLAFAQKGQYRNRIVDVHESVRSTVQILEHTLDRRIKLTLSLDAQTAQSKGDPTQIQMILMNLLLNAGDAMPRGGEILISSEIVHPDAEFLETQEMAARDEGYLRITIKDEGVGMDLETLRRAFEPFFTTKEFGQGSGMGLAAAFGAVRNHGGTLELFSRPGEGTRAHLYLPLFKSPAESAPGEDTHDQRTSSNSFSAGLMIIDDEENVLKGMTELLEDEGFSVAWAGSASEGLAFFRDHFKDVDLVILDMIMPDMHGSDAFRQLQSVDPHVKCLLCSGYSRDDHAEALIRQGAVGFVKKPVSRKDLCRAVSKALADPKKI